MSTPVGTVGPEWEVVVERGKIREFAAAMQCDLPEYQGADAVVPPTFLASAGLWAPEGARIGHGFDRRRLLHGEQEYRFLGPHPRAGQSRFVGATDGGVWARWGAQAGTRAAASMEPIKGILAELKQIMAIDDLH